MSSWEKLFDGHISLGSDATGEYLAGLPSSRGIALVVADESKPVVLLPAASMKSRIRNRLRNPSEEENKTLPDLQAVAKKVYFVRASSIFETDITYFELARRIFPDSFRDLMSVKLPWFVGVNLRDDHPFFHRSRKLVGNIDNTFGPFYSAKKADAFIFALAEIFQLCRKPSLPARSPYAKACSYGQMGICLRVCDGSIDFARYSQIVTAAADFASGNFDDTRSWLTGQMNLASSNLDFELASKINRRIGCLDKIVAGEFYPAGPIDEFTYLLVCPGFSRRQARVFLVRLGQPIVTINLDYPLADKQLAKLIAKMQALTSSPICLDEASLWRLALVSQNVFAAIARRTVALRWNDRIDSAKLTQVIEENKQVLRLGKKQ